MCACGVLSFFVAFWVFVSDCVCVRVCVWVCVYDCDEWVPPCVQFIGFMKRVLGGSLSDCSLPLRAVLTVLAFVLRNVLLFYPLILFMLLSWERCVKVCTPVQCIYCFGGRPKVKLIRV